MNNELSRRKWMQATAASALGVTFSELGSPTQLHAQSGGGGKAKSLIYIYLSGGLSQLDTFDPKRSSSDSLFADPVDTNVNGLKFGALIPKVAKCADKLAVVRSMTTQNGAHKQGQYQMLTGHNIRGTITHPSVGSFAQAVLGKRGSTIPDSVSVGVSNTSSGFLKAELEPIPIPSPAGGLPNSDKSYLSDDEFQSRVGLSKVIGSDFARKYQYDQLTARLTHYEEAIKLLDSSELEVFDITKESNRAQYGETQLGQGCLLARRLVESGVRVVEVHSGGWDHHVNIDKELPKMTTALDNALSALLLDLESKGLLETTLVAIGTEFGRSPEINHANGRDHHPAAFSCAFAGGGIQGGQIYGETDTRGKRVKKDPVTPSDFHATMGYALGIDLEKEIHAPNGRPFKFGGGGKPVTRLFGT